MGSGVHLSQIGVKIEKLENHDDIDRFAKTVILILIVIFRFDMNIGKPYRFEKPSKLFKTHMSNVQNPVDIPLYWLVDRDPYNGLL